MSMIWISRNWDALLFSFWHHCWRAILLCSLFLVLTAVSMRNSQLTRTAIRDLTSLEEIDPWQLTAQSLHVYADEIAQIALSADYEQQSQTAERIKAIVSNCESEIYRLEHSAKEHAEWGSFNVEAIRHLFCRAKDESLNVIHLPLDCSSERRALQSVILTQSIATIHSTIDETIQTRGKSRTHSQSASIQNALDSAEWSWSTLFCVTGLLTSLYGVASDWHSVRNRERHSSSSDGEYLRDFAIDGPVAMLALDLTGTVRWINRAAAEMFQSAREVMIGTSLQMLVTETERLVDLLGRLQKGESVTAYAITLRAYDGSKVQILLDANSCTKHGYVTHIRCAFHDVTGRLQVEQAYRASERRLKALVDHSPTGVFVTDSVGACTFVNQKWCELAGMSTERAAGTGWVDAVHPDDRQRVYAEWQRCASSGEDFLMEYRYQLPTGQSTWIVGRAVAVRNEAGEITQFLGNVTDITQLKLTEDLLVKERMHLHAILETANDGIVVIDGQGIVESANPAVERLFGYTSAEIVGHNISKLMPSPHREQHDGYIRTFVNTGEKHVIGSSRREMIGVRKDGSEVSLELSVSVMPSDSAVRFTGILRDVSERKAAEERILRSEERFELAVSGSNDVVWDWNIETDEVYHSPRLAALLGYDIAEMRPTKEFLFELIHPEDRTRTQTAIDEHLTDDIPFSTEFRWRTKGGFYRWFKCRGSVARVRNGRPTRMVGTTSDITDLKQQEESLRQNALQLEESHKQIERQSIELIRQAEMLRSANERAQAASDAKGQFLANMSHEIRTPLNSILGMTELALEGDLSKEKRELLGTVQSSGQHLYSLINDILDFSKIEAGKLNLELIAFDIRNCVQHAVEMLNLTAENNGVALTYNVADTVPSYLLGDVGRLRQILLNLIGNAIKFTSQGEVGLSVRPAVGHSSSSRWWFTVRDTGIGIPADKIDTIFYAFEQADSSTTRRFGGSGLGLSIVRALVEMMNGRVWVVSELGNGSEFHFEVELPVDDEIASPKHTAFPILKCSTSPLNVLVAEDAIANQRLVRMFLEKQGHHVTVVENGRAAVEAVSSHSFDLILMDIQMPILNGLEATGLIRRSSFTTNTHKIPIIALTANAMQGDREACLASGMNGYVAKPIRREELYTEIHRVIVEHATSTYSGAEQDWLSREHVLRGEFIET